MSPIIEELLSGGFRIKLIVTGSSMYPFLRHEIDSFELFYDIRHNVRKCDIVLIQRENGQYILHRVVKVSKDKAFYLAGDAQSIVEGPIMYDQLIGVVTKVFRREKEINCESFLWRMLSTIWILMLPARPIIIIGYRKVFYGLRLVKKIFG